MKVATVIVGALAVVTLAHSDDTAGLPKLLGGRRILAEVKARKALSASRALADKQESVIEKRQSSDGRCGAGVGSCSNCCSAEGYCGTGPEFCAAPDCQYQFGPQCDANLRPAGDSTEGIPRPLIGNVPYGGAGVYTCVTPGTVAYTFDDGPYLYTSDLLDKMKTYNAKGTFFISGNNNAKGAIDTTPQWSNVIKRMIAEGHQVASHTWSHQSLDKVDADTFTKQMIYNEMAFRNIMGKFPTYMRPPYSQCEQGACGSRLRDLGYHAIYFDLDTAGYLNDDASLIQKSKDIWDQAINSGNSATNSFLEIEHDIHYQTVYNLTDHILSTMYSKGFRSVTVGECLGDPQENWYRSAGNAPTGTPSTPAPAPAPNSSAGAQAISIDGSCSATTTCAGSKFGTCCSKYGWCGSTADYCGLGCNSASGTCGNSGSNKIVSEAPGLS